MPDLTLQHPAHQKLWSFSRASRQHYSPKSLFSYPQLRKLKKETWLIWHSNLQIPRSHDLSSALHMPWSPCQNESKNVDTFSRPGGLHWKNTNSCSFDPSIWHLWTFFLSYCNGLSSTVQEVSCVSCANFTSSFKSTTLPKFCASSLLCYLNISGKDHIMNFAKMSDSKNSIWAARPISVFKFLP